LERADGELSGVDDRYPELAAEAVRLAMREVEELTGASTVDDVLDEVFQTFCIGK
jgi:tRNA U34 5-carboxymethylaminomethyl modifying GTPase MnmE/TrmE